MSMPSAVLVDEDPSIRREVAQVLEEADVAIAAQLDGIDRLPRVLAGASPPRIVIVNLEPDVRESLRRVSSVAARFPGVSLIALARPVSAERVIDALDAGVKAFVPLPLDRLRLIAAIERLGGSHGSVRRARVVHVVPTIGGCGATTIACGVAAALAKAGKTLLIDLDLVRGAVANGFDVRPRVSVADLTAAGAELDPARLNAAAAIHRESGLAVLARPEAPEDAQRVTSQGLARLLEIASAAYDFILLDSTMAIDPFHAAAAQAADVNVLVAQLSVPSAKNAERYLNGLRRLGVDVAATSTLIVNRFTPERSDIQASEIERALGLKIAWTLPNDFATAMGAINFGEPVTLRSPRTELSRSMVGLAQLLSGRPKLDERAAASRHQVRSPT